MTDLSQQDPRSQPGVALVMLILVVAGLLKLTSFDDFRLSLETWSILPSWARAPIAVLVPTFEISAAVSWFMGFYARQMRWAVVVFLVFVTLAYGVQSIVAEPPRCECLGKILAFEAERRHWWIISVRNLLLILILVGPRRWFVLSPKRASAPGMRESAGFSVIELLVVIAVIATLIAISVPVLSLVRAKAKDAQSLSRFSAAYRAVAVYAGENKDVHPYLVSPVSKTRVEDVRGIQVRFSYFEQSSYWTLCLAESYFGLPWDSPSLQPMGNLASASTGIWYSHTFVSSPEYWNLEKRRGESQWRTTATSDVLFPSDKVLLVIAPGWDEERQPSRPNPRLVLAICDGSASWTEWDKTLFGVMPGEDAILAGAPALVWPGMSTVDGVRGRDLRR
jgi:prepilin-type N-terminal cleavage/methylation domain-containing protein